MGVMIANLPVSLTGNHLPAPLLALMPIYYWALVRPDVMSPAWVFLIGLTEDVLAPGAPGVWALSFVAAYAVINRQRDALASLSGLGAIMGFATAVSVACVTAYLIVSFLSWRVLPVTPILVELAVTVLLFIPAASFLSLVHRRLVGPMRSDF